MRWDFLRFSYYQVLFIIFFHIFALAIKLQVFQWSDRLPETCLQWIMVISNIKYDFFVRILWFFRLKDLLIHVVVFFFYLGFLLRTFTNHRTAGEGGGHFFNSSLPLPSASQTLSISRAITAESSPLHIASSRTQTGNLWFPSASR